MSGVENHENQVSLREALVGLLNSELLQRGRRGVKTGSVDQPKAMRADDDSLFNEISRCSLLGADQRTFTANQAIQETALSDVWLADNHGLDAIPQHFAVVTRGQQSLGLLGQLLEFPHHVAAIFRWQVFVGK